MRYLFDNDWKFHKGDVSSRPLGGKDIDTLALKIGYAPNEASPGMHDKSWRSLSLPHDWAIENDPVPWENPRQGYYPQGLAWYRKSFKLPGEAEGKKIFLEFEGISRKSEAWINGFQLGRHQSGYTPFWCDITDFVPRGLSQECDEPKTVDDKSEVLVVRVDASDPEGWWYEGCGIYRHVWLHILDRLHFVRNGLWWTTQSISNSSAKVEAHARILNEYEEMRSFQLTVSIADKNGKIVEGRMNAELRSGEERNFVIALDLPSPRLWSPETPNLYEISAEIAIDGKMLDASSSPLGIREFYFDPNTGFHLNGKPYKLQGVNCHQDFAVVGVALSDRLHEKRVELLKEMGCNAFRCAHNPPATAFLEACDRLGLLVMDENRRLDTTPEGIEDLKSMIRRDRPHPSVFSWSLCNEEFALTLFLGSKPLKTLAKIARAEDSTRPLSFAGNYFAEGCRTLNVCAELVELPGRNYSTDAYDQDHRKYPSQILMATECNALEDTRGVYTSERKHDYVLAPIDKPMPGVNSGRRPDGIRPMTLRGELETWRIISERPFVTGGFLWTGMDYRGECSWPHVLNEYGVIDICGFPKDIYYYFRAWWRPEIPLLHIFPHWTWPGMEGKNVYLRVFGNCDEVDLLVNGKSQGRMKMPTYGVLEWQTIYQPGAVIALGYTKGREICRQEIKTAGEPARIELSADRIKLSADGRDLVCITARLLDKEGTLVPRRRPEICFSVEGEGKFLGSGNGDALDHTLDASQVRTPFGGLCMAMAQSTESPGMLTVLASSNGLHTEKLCLKTE